MFAVSDRRVVLGEKIVFLLMAHISTHQHTHTHTCTLASNAGTVSLSGVHVFIHSLTYSLLNTHHMPSSVMGGRLRAPCLRELRALHRPCSMPFRCRFSCPFLPCWVQPTLFLNTLGSVMMRALTHLPWDGSAPSVTSSLLVFIQQSHTSHIWPKWTPFRQAVPLLSADALHRSVTYGWESICALGLDSITLQCQGRTFWCVPSLFLELDISL